MKTTVEHASGSGLCFPIQLEDGLVTHTSGWELIKSGIFNILAFEYGERYFQRDFGCNLEKLLEEPNDQVLEAQLLYRLNQQITQWENRVVITGITAKRNLGELHIQVNVTLRFTNPIQNTTFDYIL